MSLSRTHTAFVVGLGLCLTACITGSNESEEARAILAPQSTTLSGVGGTQGTNGLDGRALDEQTQMLLEATTKPLSTTAPNVNNDIINTGLLDTDNGRNVFAYAVWCGGPAGTNITADGYWYTGVGYPSTSSDWLNEALSDSAKEDLFACLIARVNTYDFKIPILLTGENVANDGLDHSEFTISEALWTATYNPANNTISYDVWPHPDLANYCTEPPVDFFDERTCDQGIGCAVTVHAGPNDFANECSQHAITGHYTCNGRFAVRTWLMEENVTDLHPGCFEPG